VYVIGQLLQRHLASESYSCVYSEMSALWLQPITNKVVQLVPYLEDEAGVCT